MKQYLKEHLYIAGSIEQLENFISYELKKCEHWVKMGANVESNTKAIVEILKPAEEALKSVHNLEDLFNLLK